MRRVLLLLICLGFALGGCGEVEWFPEQGVTAFSFSPASVVGVDPGSVQTSGTVTVGVKGSAVPISVTGGEYSINGGTYTPAAGTVSDGASVSVRHTAAAAAGQTVTTTLTIGDKSASFSSTTGGFAEDARFNVEPNSLQTSDAMTVSLAAASAPISISGGEYSIKGGPFRAEAGNVNNGDSVAVRHTAANGTTETTVTTTLTVGGKRFTFLTTTAAVAAQTVTATGPANTEVITEITLRLVPGSYTISVPDGFGNVSIDGVNYPELPRAFDLTDGQTIFLTDNGSAGTTVFLIGGVPITYNVTNTP